MMTTKAQPTFTQAIIMIAEMQNEYEKLVKSNSITKSAICNICVPVRDTLGITDLEVLTIARKEKSLSEIIAMLSEKGVTNAA